MIKTGFKEFFGVAEQRFKIEVEDKEDGDIGCVDDGDGAPKVRSTQNIGLFDANEDGGGEGTELMVLQNKDGLDDGEEEKTVTAQKGDEQGFDKGNMLFSDEDEDYGDDLDNELEYLENELNYRQNEYFSRDFWTSNDQAFKKSKQSSNKLEFKNKKKSRRKRSRNSEKDGREEDEVNAERKPFNVFQTMLKVFFRDQNSKKKKVRDKWFSTLNNQSKRSKRRRRQAKRVSNLAWAILIASNILILVPFQQCPYRPGSINRDPVAACGRWSRQVAPIYSFIVLIYCVLNILAVHVLSSKKSKKSRNLKILVISVFIAQMIRSSGELGLDSFDDYTNFRLKIFSISFLFYLIFLGFRACFRGNYVLFLLSMTFFVCFLIYKVLIFDIYIFERGLESSGLSKIEGIRESQMSGLEPEECDLRKIGVNYYQTFSSVLGVLSLPSKLEFLVRDAGLRSIKQLSADCPSQISFPKIEEIDQDSLTNISDLARSVKQKLKCFEGRNHQDNQVKKREKNQNFGKFQNSPEITLKLTNDTKGYSFEANPSKLDPEVLKRRSEIFNSEKSKITGDLPKRVYLLQLEGISRAQFFRSFKSTTKYLKNQNQKNRIFEFTRFQMSTSDPQSDRLLLDYGDIETPQGLIFNKKRILTHYKHKGYISIRSGNQCQFDARRFNSTQKGYYLEADMTLPDHSLITPFCLHGDPKSSNLSKRGGLMSVLSRLVSKKKSKITKNSRNEHKTNNEKSDPREPLEVDKCIQADTDLVFRWSEKLLNLYKTSNSSIFYQTSLDALDPQSLKFRSNSRKIDSEITNFLRFISSSSTLSKNSITILLSTSGNFGNMFFTKTASGGIEKHNPFLFIILGGGETASYSETLQANRGKLVSVLDLHKSLKEMIGIEMPDSDSGRFSSTNFFNLFKESIPGDRDCEVIGVADSDCICEFRRFQKGPEIADGRKEEQEERVESNAEKPSGSSPGE